MTDATCLGNPLLQPSAATLFKQPAVWLLL